MMMVGRDVRLMRVVAGERRGEEAGDHARPAAAPALEVEGPCVRRPRIARLRGVSFSVAPGEIVAVAGVEGNGRPELEETLFGLRMPRGGSACAWTGEDVTRAEPAERMGRGLGLCPRTATAVA